MKGVSTPRSSTLLATCGPLTTLCPTYDINLGEVAIGTIGTHQSN